MNKTRILVVDDDEVARLGHTRSFADSHCQVETASSGNEALRAMERNPFDVVLLDLRMPGLDGLSVLKTLKERWPDSEVIIVTGFPSIDSAKEAVRLGAYDYLTKPVAPPDLINAAYGAVMRKKWGLRRDMTLPHASAGSRARSREHGAVHRIEN
jgi:DNA-binding NtrC family response regulator